MRGIGVAVPTLATLPGSVDPNCSLECKTSAPVFVAAIRTHIGLNPRTGEAQALSMRRVQSIRSPVLILKPVWTGSRYYPRRVSSDA